MLWLSPYRSPAGLSGTTASLAQYVADNIENEIRSKIIVLSNKQNCNTVIPKRPRMWKSIMNPLRPKLQ